ncbi:crAss001_48 related protein [Cupriavidus basilensis]|uniref:crAss001_48 related protein n=1 Tax=Cupriavidus basilensis TaxID=68895 RepID=UPI0020A64C3A|nr:hypothetical protein [Cupriavidus basilensis]MCP3017467.1 hypothetical protein [Cupriavidus basilensis]
MKPHQQRVVDEKQALDGNIDKLYAFFSNPIYSDVPAAEQVRLVRQYSAMRQYSSILGERIEAFTD